MAAEDDEETSLADCIRSLRLEFNNYDQLVDVVSCWHSFFDYCYASNNCGLFFDRFPTMGENALTPDFSMLFSSDYGIVGEIARSIDKSPEVLASKVGQLKKYDGEMHLKADLTGRTVKPKVHDIMLLLHSDFSNKGAMALHDYWDSHEDERPSNNVIIMEYNYSTGDVQSKYVFKKSLHFKNGTFRDDSLPGSEQLERTLGAGSSIRMEPGHFVMNKAVNMFCNDKPPAIYLATRLWDRVFPTLLTDEQRRVWRRGSSTKVQKIETSSTDLQAYLRQQVIPGSGLARDWIEDALKFLETCGRAERNGTSWQIKYSNLKIKRAKSGSATGDASLERMREYGDILAEMYCKGRRGQLPALEEEPQEEIGQRRIFDFDDDSRPNS